MNQVETPTKRREWLTDVVVGGLIGGLVGVVTAWNLMIYLGLDRGYETSLLDAFDHSLMVGVPVIAALVGGPVVGIGVARRQRKRRSR